MLKHPLIEIEALKEKNIWSEVVVHHASEAGIVAIPTTWGFKYTFDEDGYLIKYKACLCARDDLQHTNQDTFAATLAARIF